MNSSSISGNLPKAPSSEDQPHLHIILRKEIVTNDSSFNVRTRNYLFWAHFRVPKFIRHASPFPLSSHMHITLLERQTTLKANQRGNLNSIGPKIDLRQKNPYIFIFYTTPCLSPNPN